jgi:hypothetical protein
MRSRTVLCGVVLSFYVTVACGDEPTLYPPLPMISNGAQSSGAAGSGATNSGNTAGRNPGGSSGGKSGTAGSSPGGNEAGDGNVPSTAGSSGSQGTGGSANPNPNYCEDFNGGDAPPEPTVACDLSALTNGGDLTGDLNDKTLESGKYYTLKGVTRVLPGKTLTIPPCVEIRGQDPGAVLVVLAGPLGTTATCSFPEGSTVTPGGKIMAVGEPMAPIIFTSAKPKGSRAPGDWGGVIILGNAQNSAASKNTRDTVEGLEVTECHGMIGTEFNEESSGRLEYARIEFASRQTGQDQETNGLTLGSVGSGTSIHHVMVSNSNDDCFEWFGGTVNAHHLIALNCDDDEFDADKGYAGHVQFIFGRQYPSTTEADSRGFEIDSNGGKQPFTTVQFSNYTLCGGGPEDAAPAEASQRAGLVFRASAKSSQINGLVTGFRGGGISVQNANSTVEYTTVFDTTRLYGANHAGGLDWLSKQMGNEVDDPPGFCDCWSNPPQPVPRDTQLGTTPVGFEDEGADYRGAFASSSPDSNWMKGLWVDWSED